MTYMRLLLCAIILAASTPALATQKQCGAETFGAPVKTKKTINGVSYNCDSTTCSKSCCTLADPPVCSIEKKTTSSCTQALTGHGGIDKFKAPSGTLKRQ
jgi:hypothetical protein